MQFGVLNAAIAILAFPASELKPITEVAHCAGVHVNEPLDEDELPLEDDELEDELLDDELLLDDEPELVPVVQ